MAPKRPNPMEDPAVASSSEEESDDEEDPEQEISSSEEEEDDEERTPLGLPVSAVVEPHPSDSDSGSETETDSDSEKDITESIVKPEAILAKAPQQVSDAIKPKAPIDTATQTKSVRKTPMVKRAKMDNGEAGKEEKKPEEVSKKQAFHRLWSEEDEISLLKGMLEFKSDTGVSPSDDTTGYYDFIKKSISFEVSKAQLMDKIRALRKKYVNNLSKAKPGDEQTFSKPHDQTTFDLSKSIWGTGASISDSVAKTNGRSKKSRKERSKAMDSLKQDIFSYPNGNKVADGIESSHLMIDRAESSSIVKLLCDHGLDEFLAKQGWASVSLEDKQLFEVKWRKIQIEMLDLYQKQIDFNKEVSTLILEALRGSDR